MNTKTQAQTPLQSHTAFELIQVTTRGPQDTTLFECDRCGVELVEVSVPKENAHPDILERRGPALTRWCA